MLFPSTKIKKSTVLISILLFVVLVKNFGDVGKNVFFGSVGVDLTDQPQFPELLDDGHGVLEVGDEALAQRLLVIVRSSGTGGSSLQTPVDAHLLVAVEEEDAGDGGLVPAHLGVPAVQVVLVAREPVDQEVSLAGLLHGAGQQRTGDGHRHDRTVGDVVLDQIPELRTRRLALSP